MCAGKAAFSSLLLHSSTLISHHIFSVTLPMPRACMMNEWEFRCLCWGSFFDLSSKVKWWNMPLFSHHRPHLSWEVCWVPERIRAMLMVSVGWLNGRSYGCLCWSNIEWNKAWFSQPCNDLRRACFKKFCFENLKKQKSDIKPSIVTFVKKKKLNNNNNTHILFTLYKAALCFLEPREERYLHFGTSTLSEFIQHMNSTVKHTSAVNMSVHSGCVWPVVDTLCASQSHWFSTSSAASITLTPLGSVYMASVN